MKDSKTRSFALRWAAFACVVVSSGACGAPEREEVAESGMEATPSERRPTTAATDGEQTLQQHMERISAVPADSLVHVMPQHLETVGAMLDELDPTALGMQSDTVWRATLDSVQNDLGRMRDMHAAALREIMPDHRRRIDRILSMHDSAMGSER